MPIVLVARRTAWTTRTTLPLAPQLAVDSGVPSVSSLATLTLVEDPLVNITFSSTSSSSQYWGPVKPAVSPITDGEESLARIQVQIVVQLLALLELAIVSMPSSLVAQGTKLTPLLGLLEMRGESTSYVIVE